MRWWINITFFYLKIINQHSNIYKQSIIISHSKSSESLAMVGSVRYFCACRPIYVACSLRERFTWFFFFPAPGVVGKVRFLSVDVEDGHDRTWRKQASLAFWRWTGVISFHASTVTRCFAWLECSMSSPRPHNAWSASVNWPRTSSRSLLIRSGSCCSLHLLYCLITWLQLLLVHPGRLATTLSHNNWWMLLSKYDTKAGGPATGSCFRSFSTRSSNTLTSGHRHQRWRCEFHAEPSIDCQRGCRALPCRCRVHVTLRQCSMVRALTTQSGREFQQLTRRHANENSRALLA